MSYPLAAVAVVVWAAAVWWLYTETFIGEIASTALRAAFGMK